MRNKTMTAADYLRKKSLQPTSAYLDDPQCQPNGETRYCKVCPVQYGLRLLDCVPRPFMSAPLQIAETIERLNALPKHRDAGRPLQPLLQFVFHHGGWWVETQINGWSRTFSYHYTTLDEAVRRWRVTITAFENGMWKAEVSR